jgi:hypothetical protein
MKELTVITTFSENGYVEYGKRWIESNLKYWPADTKFIIYTDFDLAAPTSQFKIKNFNDEFPTHSLFVSSVLNRLKNTQKEKDIAQKTIKFSFKGYVITNELLNAKNGYLIWLDGDTETLSHVNESVIEQLLDCKFLACQSEKSGKHIESGILIFDCEKTETFVFSKKLKEQYFDLGLFCLRKPYDGYIIADILNKTKLNFNDLNKEFNFDDLKSKKEDTFQHPLLKKHFCHWIGNSK